MPSSIFSDVVEHLTSLFLSTFNTLHTLMRFVLFWVNAFDLCEIKMIKNSCKKKKEKRRKNKILEVLALYENDY